MSKMHFVLLFMLALPAFGQETGEDAASSIATADEVNADADSDAVSEADNEDAEGISNGDGIESPKAMSGMSILGNEEAPKSLVIIPWKSSELGENISLSDSLDDRARPVDKEVFLRELSFYEIRSAEK